MGLGASSKAGVQLCLALNGALYKYLAAIQTTVVVELGVTEAS